MGSINVLDNLPNISIACLVFVVEKTTETQWAGINNRMPATIGFLGQIGVVRCGERKPLADD